LWASTARRTRFIRQATGGMDAARFRNDGTNVDPYIQMIGGEFMIHGGQQKAG